MIHARVFAEAAESLHGTRWCRHGRNPNVGLDCAGLVIAAARAAGFDPRDTTDYDPRMPSTDTLREFCELNGVSADVSDCGEGRVGVCRARQRIGSGCHLVVMLAGRRIAHVDTGARRVVVVSSSWLDGRLLSVWRLRDAEYGSPW